MLSKNCFFKVGDRVERNSGVFAGIGTVKATEILPNRKGNQTWHCFVEWDTGKFRWMNADGLCKSVRAQHFQSI